MRLLIASALLVFPSASGYAQLPVVPAPPAQGGAAPALGGKECSNGIVHHARTPPKAEMKRLDELPPGDLILTVVRDVEGCQEPVIVGQGYGFGAPLGNRGGAPQPLKPRRW